MFKNYIIKNLENLDIKIGGDRPWDIKILDVSFFDDILKRGTVAIGEGYVNKKWECDDLLEMYTRVFLDFKFHRLRKNKLFVKQIYQKIFNKQKLSRSKIVGEECYDEMNDVHESFIDPETMSYTSGVFITGEETLGEAQFNKLEMICRKLNIKPGDKVLDIGCGWGNFMKYASEKYGAVCTGLSVSSVQIESAKKRCKNLPINFLHQSYQTYVPLEKYDHVVSIEMLEHVGRRNYDDFFKKAYSFLKDDGKMYLQTSSNKDKDDVGYDPWIEKYIFQNGEMPTLELICKAFRKVGSEGSFVVENIENIGYFNYLTLMKWYQNFKNNFEKLSKENPEKYTESCYRIWEYYFLYCAAMYKSRWMQLYSIVLSKKGNTPNF